MVAPMLLVVPNFGTMRIPVPMGEVFQEPYTGRKSGKLLAHSRGRGGGGRRHTYCRHMAAIFVRTLLLLTKGSLQTWLAWSGSSSCVAAVAFGCKFSGKFVSGGKINKNFLVFGPSVIVGVGYVGF